MFTSEDTQGRRFTTCSPIAAHQVAKYWNCLTCEHIGWNGELSVRFHLVAHGQQLQRGEKYALAIDEGGCVIRAYPTPQFVPEFHRFNIQDIVPQARWSEIYGGKPCIYSQGGCPDASTDDYYQRIADINDDLCMAAALNLNMEMLTYEPSDHTPRSEASISDHDDIEAQRAAEQFYAQFYFADEPAEDEPMPDTVHVNKPTADSL